MFQSGIMARGWTLLLFLMLAGTGLWSLTRREPHPAVPVDKARTQDTTAQRLQKFSLTGYDDKGAVFWNLEGETAKIDPAQTVHLDEKVTLRLQDDTVIRTERVDWSQDAGTLTTEAPVAVENPHVKIKGVGALGRPNESFVQINRSIDMVVNGVTHLVCSGPMKIYHKEHRMVFFRNVKVTDRRGTVTAKRMEVFFDPGQRKVERIVATGDVVIHRGTDTTRSQKAVYNLATGSVRLEGSADITIHKGGASVLNGSFGS